MDSEKSKTNTISNQDFVSTLERTIEFVKSCDNKASISFGIFGVVVSVLLTNTNLINQFRNQSFLLSNTFRLISCIAAGGTLIAWMVFLVLCIFARTKVDYKSLIYFGEIANFRTSEQYIKSLKKYTKQAYLEDVCRQIYINSVICKKKHTYYNLALIFMSLSFCFMFLFFIAM